MQGLGRRTFTLGALLTILGVTSCASAAAIPSPNSITIWAAASTEGHGPVAALVTGAIVDYGKILRANGRFQPDATGGFTELVLKRGSILLRGTALSPSIRTTTVDSQSHTCSVLTTSDKPTSIVTGTRAYVGITGSLVVATNSVLILPIAENGQCQTGGGIRPVAAWSTITASGTVTFTPRKK